MSARTASACCDGREWCAITCTSELLARKWHTIIVHELIEQGRARFSELKRGIEGLSGKVLSESLDDLREKGLVTRSVVQRSPERVEYGLTQAGADLEAVISAMEAWGQAYLDPARSTVNLAGLDEDRVPRGA